MSAPAETLTRFVALSAALTGVSPVALWGTGQAEAYLAAVRGIVPPAILDDLLALHAGPDQGGAQGDTITAQLLQDGRLGPVARNLILLWYRGTWSQLPAAWRLQFGVAEGDRDHLLSGDAYQAGLQWLVAGAHPPGARHQGYASWALPPRPMTGDLPA